MAVHAPAPRSIADVVADVSADLDPFLDTCICPAADWDDVDWGDAFARGFRVARRHVDKHTADHEAAAYANASKLTAYAHRGLHVPRGGRRRPDTSMRRLRLLLRGRADDPDRVLRSP